MTELPEPNLVTAQYKVCCLPEEHPDYVAFMVTVNRRWPGLDRSATPGYSVEDHDNFYDLGPTKASRPILFPAEEAIELAKQVAPHVIRRGRTVAEAWAGKPEPE